MGNCFPLIKSFLESLVQTTPHNTQKNYVFHFIYLFFVIFGYVFHFISKRGQNLNNLLIARWRWTKGKENVMPLRSGTNQKVWYIDIFFLNLAIEVKVKCHSSYKQLVAWNTFEVTDYNPGLFAFSHQRFTLGSFGRHFLCIFSTAHLPNANQTTSLAHLRTLVGCLCIARV